jgi:hypothetical protein
LWQAKVDTNRPIPIQLPQAPKKMGARFHFYTPDQPNLTQVIDYFNLQSSISNLTADFELPLTMIVHGFTPQADPHKWMLDAKDALVGIKV